LIEKISLLKIGIYRKVRKVITDENGKFKLILADHSIEVLTTKDKIRHIIKDSRKISTGTIWLKISEELLVNAKKCQFNCP